MPIIMKRMTPAEKEALRKVGSEGGKAAADKLTPEERKARAKAAGIASGKARKKKVRK
jgi:hypothetical protein